MAQDCENACLRQSSRFGWEESSRIDKIWAMQAVLRLSDG
jgi:hypothetical protein